MALSFSEGSIGGDIERVNLLAAGGVLRRRIGAGVEDGVRGHCQRALEHPAEPTGRTASPSRRRASASGKALLGSFRTRRSSSVRKPTW
ncbi:MAG: hypothetical protein R2712_14590 [Vicinamibacterales bacterium]